MAKRRSSTSIEPWRVAGGAGMTAMKVPSRA